jgi:hypothetical protein
LLYVLISLKTDLSKKVTRTTLAGYSVAEFVDTGKGVTIRGATAVRVNSNSLTRVLRAAASMLGGSLVTIEIEGGAVEVGDVSDGEASGTVVFVSGVIVGEEGESKNDFPVD